MNIEEIKKKVKTEEYEFLRTNEHLGDNIVLLTLGGSHAYGMDTPTSDLDIRGVALNTADEILTGNYYEQFVNKKTDTVVYSLNKILSLLINCNPNTIEMLGCRPDQYLYLSDVGEDLIKSRDMFLSKRAVNSFGGYANQQLRRLQNAMARDSYPNEEREKHILNTIRNMKYHLKETYGSFDEDSLKLYIDKSDKEDLPVEIFMDFSLNHFALRDYRGIMSEMNTVINEFQKLNKRNTKKDANHLAKHMAHLLRLYMMALDILERGEIITYREKEHDLLMEVRKGKFLIMADDETIEKVTREAERLREKVKKEDYEDDLEYEMAKAAVEREIEKAMTGIYKVTDEFWDILGDYEKHFERAKKETKLPDQPDYKRIREFQKRTNLSVINNR